MKHFNGKISVITGAASGIGEALAQQSLQEGMYVVLADIEEETLENTANQLRGEFGDKLITHITDVSDKRSIESLAKKTLDHYGAAHLLFNNAGVGAGFNIGNTSYDDWEWVLGVNLWGVIYGTKTFLPILEAQDEECHIVNTSSTTGILPGYGSVPYAVSKHGVVALSEAVYFDLAERKSNTGISVLCPGGTATNILKSDRNRPDHYTERSKLPNSKEYLDALFQMVRNVKGGMSAQNLASIAFKGIRENKLYITSQEDLDEAVLGRAHSILSGS